MDGYGHEEDDERDLIHTHRLVLKPGGFGGDKTSDHHL